MAINKTDYLKFGENLFEIVPPAPSETERGGIIASPRTETDTVEAKIGDDGKLYVPEYPIVYDWAKQETKPEYTAEEVGAATEEYVNTSIANLIDNAPEELNTLNELAIAMKENSDVVDVLNSAITQKKVKDILVTITRTTNEDNTYSYTADKTFEEIDIAISQGTTVILYYSNMYFTVSRYTAGQSIYFTNIWNFNDTFVSNSSFIIGSDNIITYISIGQIEVQKNRVLEITSDMITSANRYPSVPAVMKYAVSKTDFAEHLTSTALILSSPNGTKFQITIGDDGILNASEITT